MPEFTEQQIQDRIDAAVAKARQDEALAWWQWLKGFMENSVRELSFTLMHRRDFQKEATARIISAGLGEDIIAEVLGIERLMGNDCARWTHERKEAIRRGDNGDE